MNKSAFLEKLVLINKEMITVAFEELFKSNTMTSSRAMTSSKAMTASLISRKADKLIVSADTDGGVNLTTKKLGSILDIAESYAEILIKMLYVLEEMNTKIEDNPNAKPSAALMSKWTAEIIEDGFDEAGNFNTRTDLARRIS